MGIVFTIIVISISIFTFLWVSGKYNQFVKFKQSIDKYWSNLLAEYQRRADLFYNLSEAVKKYYSFEDKAHTAIVAARSNNLIGVTKQEQMKAMNKADASMASVLPRLIALQEKYPALKAINQFDNFSKEIRITEDRINNKRIEYNEIVEEYNLLTKQFPSLIAAFILGFKAEEYYTNEKNEGEKEYKIKIDAQK